MKEIIDIFSWDNPITYILGTIFALYFIVKIYRDISEWIIELKNRKDKKITDELTRCNIEHERITVLEQAIVYIKEKLTKLEEKIDRILK